MYLISFKCFQLLDPWLEFGVDEEVCKFGAGSEEICTGTKEQSLGRHPLQMLVLSNRQVRNPTLWNTIDLISEKLYDFS